MPRRPILYLLSGLPCSGKTTHAVKLEASGVVRVSVDDLLLESAGRLGVDYDEAEHLALLAPLVRTARGRVIANLAAGRDVVLDHGLGRRSERDELKELASAQGATWSPLSFDADLETLRSRCRQRAERPDQVPISDATLAMLAGSWERPVGEGEIRIESS